jgi:hypothetical protein
MLILDHLPELKAELRENGGLDGLYVGCGEHGLSSISFRVLLFLVGIVICPTPLP